MEGSLLGPYRVRSELGSGGMGQVWLAEVADDTPGLARGASVALKVVHPHLLRAPGFFPRFLREAEIGRAVRHENVVRTLGCDQVELDGTPRAFLVMEYVEGQTLRELLDEMPEVPEELCRHVGREVARGLTAIHGAGYVHRDLKPENVLITPAHDVKVMDLGVARLADEALRLSADGAFVGSPRYASPEQFRAVDDLDGRADLFSLGLVLYEMAAGAHPHPADDFAALLAKIVDERPRALAELRPQLSPFFEEVVHTLLEKDRERRFSSAAELLETLCEGERSTWWRRRARAIRAATRRPLRRIRIPRETAVYGREAEFATLRELFASAKAGEGRVVLLEGEAGIGKSRLVDELIGGLVAGGEDLNFLFGSYPPGGAATASGAWSTAYREHFGAEDLEATLAPYLEVTPALVPAFAALLRGEPAPPDASPLTKPTLQTVFVNATRGLAAERPTVVLVEDLHFAPEEGRALFAALAPAIEEHRVLLVGTTRPEIDGRWLADLDRMPHAARMELTRLGPKDLARLLEDAFGSERLAAELGHRIARKSDGNPYFAFEIIRGLREGKFITRRADGSWATTGKIEEIEVPSSVLDLIRARIADLEEAEQEILDVAACAGFEFDPTLVAAALGRRVVPVLRSLGRIERSRRLVRSAGDRFVFDHHQVAESLLDAMSDPLRREYHDAIAAALAARHPEPVGATALAITEHTLRGKPAERGVPHLVAALDHLEASHLRVEQLGLAERALAVPGLLRDADRRAVLLRAASAASFLGRRDEERVWIDEVIPLAVESGDAEREARARMMLGRQLQLFGRYDEAEAQLTAALELAEGAGSRSLEAALHSRLCFLAIYRRDYETVRREGERALTIALANDDWDNATTALNSLGNAALQQGDYETARSRMERVRGIAAEHGELMSQAVSTGNLGLVAYGLGHLAEAEARYDECLALYRRIGYRMGEAVTAHAQGTLAALLGRPGAAEESFRRAEALAGEVRAPGLGMEARICRAELALDEGDAARAAEGLSEAEETARALKDAVSLGRVETIRGRLALIAGDAEETEARFAAALDAVRPAGTPGLVALTAAHLAAFREDAAREAVELLAEAGPRASVPERLHARYWLWRATGDAEHRDRARAHFARLRDAAPEEYRSSMATNVPMHRDLR